MGEERGGEPSRVSHVEFVSKAFLRRKKQKTFGAFQTNKGTEKFNYEAEENKGDG